jgi:hypothetical protein
VTPEQSKLLADYAVAQATLTSAKEAEQRLRKLVVSTFGDASKEAGRERAYVDNIELIIDKKQNFKVLNESGQLDHIRSIMPFAVFNELFTCTWSISVAAYRKLTAAQQQVVDYCLLITDGMPALEVKKTDRV